MRTVQPRVLKHFVFGLTTGWSAVIVILFSLNFLHERALMLEMARVEARSDFQSDVSYRQWNAASGSVYVEVSKETPPNPYLSATSERDVTTTTGKKLTLVNPAYMTRLVFDLAARSHEIRGRLSSLRPVRPQNLPDAWERRALEAFERGEKEVTSVEKIGSATYLRLMRPLMTTEECLKCHGKDGYRFGDIRGGISVAVPMEPLWKILKEQILISGVIFGAIWALGLLGIFAGAHRLRRTMHQRDRAEQSVAALNRELNAANEELESFCATVSHDLRSPLAIIGGYAQLIRDSAAESRDETCVGFAEIVMRQSTRMDQLIDTLLDFSRLSRSTLQREPVHLSAIAQKVAAELCLAAPERTTEFLVAEGILAEGDAALLRVVLQNLIGNAWKYTGTRDKGVIEFGVRSKAETVYFVRDNGIGFDISQSDKMFEAFKRLPNAQDFQGSGVGLATVRRIITRHGGRVWCEGEVDKGATFYFTLA